METEEYIAYIHSKFLFCTQQILVLEAIDSTSVSYFPLKIPFEKKKSIPDMHTMEIITRNGKEKLIGK
jgi:hypothetical protein